MIIDILIAIVAPFIALVGGALSMVSNAVLPSGISEGFANLLGYLKYFAPIFPVDSLVGALIVLITFEGFVLGFLLVRFVLNLIPTNSNIR